MMNNKHIPKEFRDKFLEQMRTDDILGKDVPEYLLDSINDLLETTLTLDK